MEDGISIILIGVLILIGILIYFLPAIIANEKKNSTIIFWMNLFFGGTGIGWFIVFIWACVSEPKDKKKTTQ